MNSVRYIIRLDDVCERMNAQNWLRMEHLLDKYGIKPIVGLIPESIDPKFMWDIIPDYIEIINRYQEKGYIIAQHGCHHDVRNPVQSEFVGKTIEEQKRIIDYGYKKLIGIGMHPKCFYAPKHSFDRNTVIAIKELGYFEYISDGYSINPFVFEGVRFLPSLFNSAKKTLPFGVFTFVYHPNTMTDGDFNRLEKFLLSVNGDLFSVDFDHIFDCAKEKKSYYGLLYHIISSVRLVRSLFQKKS